MRRKLLAISSLTFTVVFGVSLAHAGDACLYGTATTPNGYKMDGEVVSTTWNGKTTIIRDGKYRLCFGSNPSKRSTVYISGKTYAEIVIDGDTMLDIVNGGKR